MNFIRLSILLTLTIVVWSCANIMWSGSHHRGIVKADGKGYYGHLPAIFLYQDLRFEFYDTVETAPLTVTTT